MKNLMILATLMALTGILQADDIMEVRSASQGEYRYADWSHSFANKMATDVYYAGVPGNNETSACIGYQLPSRLGVTLTPFFCGVIAKENKEGGAKEALVVSFQKGKINADAYLAHFTPLRGTVNSYDFLDAGNLTYSVSKRWEAGISAGFFRQDGRWNPLMGPLVRRNDRAGFWSMSYRFGPTNELRFIRSFTIKKP